MVIFNKENGKEVAYVQFEDLYFLETSDKLPKGIECEIDCEEVVTAIGADGEEVYYTRFTSYHTVQFFKAMNMLVDYKKESAKSLQELEQDGEKLNKLLNDFRKKIVDVNVDEFQKKEMLKRMAILGYRAQGLEDLYLARINGDVLTIPDVIDSDGFYEDLGTYEARRTLDGKKLFVTRKDGCKIDDETVISLDVVEEVVKADIVSRGIELPESRYIYYSYIGLNDDATALVIEYTIYKPEERKGKESLFKKLIKSFI